MKKIVVTIMALVMMVSAIAAMANSENGFSITPRIAYNYVINGDTRDELGSNYGIIADVDIASLPVGFETGYIWGKKNDFKTQIIPLLVTYTYPFADQFYAKAGMGVAFEKVKYDGDYAFESESKTNFAVKLGAGWNFAQNWTLEAAYNIQGKVAGKYGDARLDTIQFNVGYTF